jgi:hypothetical protein
MTSQKINNPTLKDLKESKVDEIWEWSMKFKRTCKNTSMNSREYKQIAKRIPGGSK